MTTLTLPTPRLRSPRAVAQFVFVGHALTVGVGAVVAAALLPEADGLARSLVAAVGVLAFSVLVGRAVAVRTGGWAAIGLTHPTEWANAKLLVLPAVITLVPLAGGVRSVDGGTLAILASGYLLTGFMEEALWRGAVERILAPVGTARAVWLGSALFGAAHLSNVLFRGNVTLVVAQAFGAFCFGVGYAALRWRINTIWPLMVLHFATDFVAAVGALPKIPVLVAQDVVLLALGVYLLRRGRVAK